MALLALALLLQQPSVDWAKLREQAARLASEDPSERATAKASLTKADKASLLEALKDKANRDAAAIALGVQGEPKAQATLLELARDKDSTLRAPAFEALGGLKIADESVFTKAFADEQPRVAFAAARGMARSNPEALRRLEAAAVAAFSTGSHKERVAAIATIVGLISIADNRLLPSLQAALQDKDPGVAVVALRAACSVGPSFTQKESATPLLSFSLRTDVKPEDRLQAAVLSLKIRRPRAKDLLLLLHDPVLAKRVFELITPVRPERSRTEVASWLALLKDEAVAKEFGATIESWIEKATGLSPKGDRIKEWEGWLEKRTSEDAINKAIDHGVACLKKAAKGDHWSNGQNDIGATALALYTLLRCGAKTTDPDVRPGLEWLLKQQIPDQGHGVYVNSLCALLFGEASATRTGEKGDDDLSARCLRKVSESAQYLIRAQNAGGSWGYSTAGGSDNSNTQFAVIGLRAAQNAGVKVPREVWAKAAQHFRQVQDPGGGWGYGGPGNPYNRMTAAGMMSLLIAESSESGKPVEKFVGMKDIQAAVDWIDNNWTVADGGGFYWLYSLERACMVAGIKKIGEHDWYVEGAELLLNIQAADGGWLGTYGIIDHCFALLFLRRAYVPVGKPTVATGGEGKPPVKTGGDSKPEKTDKPAPSGK